MSKIITKAIYPPIPDNNHDWEAYYEDWDIGDPIGYGKTEQEAINDLKEKKRIEPSLGGHNVSY